MLHRFQMRYTLAVWQISDDGWCKSYCCSSSIFDFWIPSKIQTSHFAIIVLLPHGLRSWLPNNIPVQTNGIKSWCSLVSKNFDYENVAIFTVNEFIRLNVSKTTLPIYRMLTFQPLHKITINRNFLRTITTHVSDKKRTLYNSAMWRLQIYRQIIKECACGHGSKNWTTASTG